MNIAIDPTTAVHLLVNTAFLIAGVIFGIKMIHLLNSLAAKKKEARISDNETEQGR